MRALGAGQRDRRRSRLAALAFLMLMHADAQHGEWRYVGNGLGRLGRGFRTANAGPRSAEFAGRMVNGQLSHWKIDDLPLICRLPRESF
jgi:hypothetical protein